MQSSSLGGLGKERLPKFVPKPEIVKEPKSFSQTIVTVTGKQKPRRSVAVWNTLVSACYLGYVGKFFSTTAAPLRLLTMYSLVLNATWRLNITTGRHIVAAASTLGLGMLIAYWFGAAMGGPEFLYGNDQMDEIENYDIFDDLMLHLLFPLEAFIISYTIRKSYDTYYSLLELFLFSILYIPFFIVYRPYAFVKETSLVETIGIAVAVTFCVIFLHIVLVTFFIRVIKSRLKKKTQNDTEPVHDELPRPVLNVTKTPTFGASSKARRT